MLPNEYQPLILNKTQQDVHSRYTAMGFKISPRPFAGKGDHLWFFMSLPTPENPRGIEFTINLGNGVAHRTGTQTTYEMDAIRQAFGIAETGEQQGNFENPSSEVAAAAPVVMEAAPSPVKEDHAKPPAREEKPVAAVRNSEETRGLTPLGSPEKRVPVKKKQTALF